MNIPKLFRPKKNLDDKTKELLEVKKKVDTKFSYEELFTCLDNYLKTRNPDFPTVFYISDSSEENRYDHISGIIGNMVVTNFFVKYPFDQYRLFNYYEKLENQSLHEIVSKSTSDKSSICIIYTSDDITKMLIKDDKNAPIFDRIFTITT